MYTVNKFPRGLALLVALFLSDPLQADHQSLDYQSLVDHCLRNPAGRIGSASAASCLQTELARLDAYTEDKLQQLGEQLCPPAREQLLATQQQWLAYRQQFCQVFPAIQDTSQMFLTSQTCALRLGLGRYGDLLYFKTNRPEPPVACP